MPLESAGQVPARSNTVRLADKEAKQGQVDPAVMRMAVNGWVALTGQRRKQARAVVLAYASDHGPELDGWAHWLRNWHGIADPTGESVARRVRGDLRG